MNVSNVSYVSWVAMLCSFDKYLLMLGRLRTERNKEKKSKRSCVNLIASFKVFLFYRIRVDVISVLGRLIFFCRWISNGSSIARYSKDWIGCTILYWVTLPILRNAHNGFSALAWPQISFWLCPISFVYSHISRFIINCCRRESSSLGSTIWVEALTHLYRKRKRNRNCLVIFQKLFPVFFQSHVKNYLHIIDMEKSSRH